MATLLILFMMVEFKSYYLTIQLRLKNGTYFSCCESLAKGYNVSLSLEILCHAMFGDKVLC